MTITTLHRNCAKCAATERATVERRVAVVRVLWVRLCAFLTIFSLGLTLGLILGLIICEVLSLGSL